MDWTCHLLSPWPCRCQHLCLFASAVFLWLSVHCRDLFSDDFLRAQTTGPLTGLAGSRTPLQWLCGTISMAVLPPGMWLPCAVWGTAHRGQLQICGSSFKSCSVRFAEMCSWCPGGPRVARGPCECQCWPGAVTAAQESVPVLGKSCSPEPSTLVWVWKNDWAICAPLGNGLPTAHPCFFSSLDFRNECQCNAVKKKKIQVNYCMETWDL